VFSPVRKPLIGMPMKIRAKILDFVLLADYVMDEHGYNTQSN